MATPLQRRIVSHETPKKRLPEICNQNLTHKIPDLTILQTQSYKNFLQEDVPPKMRKDQGLESVLREIFPIETYEKTTRLEYVYYELEKPRFDPDECRQLRLTYGRPFKVRLRLTRESKEPIEEDVFLGDIPIMLGGGEFIINGAERVVVSQLHRSPGIDFVAEVESGSRTFGCRIIPERGSWIELNITRKETISAKIDQSSKLPIMMLLRAMSPEYSTDVQIIKAFYETTSVKVDTKKSLSLIVGKLAVGDIVVPSSKAVKSEKTEKADKGKPEKNEKADEGDKPNEPLVKSGEKITEAVAKAIIESDLKKIEVMDDPKNKLLLNSLVEDKTKSHEEALMRIYQRLRPGNPAQLDKARELFNDKFFDVNRYRLGRVGRFRINRKLGLSINIPPDKMVLEPEDIVNAVAYLNYLWSGDSKSKIIFQCTHCRKMRDWSADSKSKIIFPCDHCRKMLEFREKAAGTEDSCYHCQKSVVVPNESKEIDPQENTVFHCPHCWTLFQLLESQDKEGAIVVPFESMEGRDQEGRGSKEGALRIDVQVDDIDHLGNRRLRTIDELAGEELRKGFLKLRRTVQERLSSRGDDVTPRQAINQKSISAAIEFFFGRSELSQVVDQTNPLSMLTHERRLSALGPGGLNRKRAGFDVRDVHSSHYGRICPIETPEGTNIGLISSLSIYAEIDEFGFLVSPYRKFENGFLTNQIDCLRADEEHNKKVAPADITIIEPAIMEKEIADFQWSADRFSQAMKCFDDVARKCDDARKKKNHFGRKVLTAGNYLGGADTILKEKFATTWQGNKKPLTDVAPYLEKRLKDIELPKLSNAFKVLDAAGIKTVRDLLMRTNELVRTNNKLRKGLFPDKAYAEIPGISEDELQKIKEKVAEKLGLTQALAATCDIWQTSLTIGNYLGFSNEEIQKEIFATSWRDVKNKVLKEVGLTRELTPQIFETSCREIKNQALKALELTPFPEKSEHWERELLEKELKESENAIELLEIELKDIDLRNIDLKYFALKYIDVQKLLDRSGKPTKPAKSGKAGKTDRVDKLLEFLAQAQMTTVRDLLIRNDPTFLDEMNDDVSEDEVSKFKEEFAKAKDELTKFKDELDHLFNFLDAAGIEAARDLLDKKNKDFSELSEKERFGIGEDELIAFKDNLEHLFKFLDAAGITTVRDLLDKKNKDLKELSGRENSGIGEEELSKLKVELNELFKFLDKAEMKTVRDLLIGTNDIRRRLIKENKLQGKALPGGMSFGVSENELLKFKKIVVKKLEMTEALAVPCNNFFRVKGTSIQTIGDILGFEDHEIENEFFVKEIVHYHTTTWQEINKVLENLGVTPNLERLLTDDDFSKPSEEELLKSLEEKRSKLSNEEHAKLPEGKRSKLSNVFEILERLEIRTVRDLLIRTNKLREVLFPHKIHREIPGIGEDELLTIREKIVENLGLAKILDVPVSKLGWCFPIKDFFQSKGIVTLGHLVTQSEESLRTSVWPGEAELKREFNLSENMVKKIVNDVVEEIIVQLRKIRLHLDITATKVEKPWPWAVPGSISGTMIVRYQGDYHPVAVEKAEYIDVAPSQMVGVSAGLIPFLEHDDANRALMGSNMQRQAVPLLVTEPPLVATGLEGRAAYNSSLLIHAKRGGTVKYVDSQRIIIEGGEGEGRYEDEYVLRKFVGLNERTCQNQNPVVKPGQLIVDDEIIADGASMYHGELCLGRNILVAFMAWDGYNFEDAIIISEDLVKKDTYTSIHIEEFDTEIRDTKLGREEFTNDIPNVGEKALRNLDEGGVIRVGTHVKPGDILVGKVTPKSKTELTPEEKLLHAIFGRAGEEVKNESLEVPSGIEGIVIGTKTFKCRMSMTEEERKAHDAETNRVEREENEKIAAIFNPMILEFEKVLGRSLKDDMEQPKLFRMEHLNIEDNDPKRKPLDKIYQKFWPAIENAIDAKDRKINSMKLGDELRRGVLQMVKVYVAAKRVISVGDKMAGRHGNKGVIAKILPREDMPFLEDGTPVEILLNPLGVPSRMNVGQILETHLGWAAQRGDYQAVTPVFEGATEEQINEKLEYACLPRHGKVKLFDGRTGEPFDQETTVGYIYMLKLHHLVDDKVHARSTGPYSLITQQPLGGKARSGGQRFGEMEVWALEAYGAAYTLQELLTVKSDDVEGRTKIYESMVKGENTLEAGTPASFDVLTNEIRGLALNMQLEKAGGV